MGVRDECNQAEFSLERDHLSIENRPGGTHPGAEQRTMRCSLMLGMVPGMFNRLCLRQPADRKDTEHHEDGQTFEHGAVHKITTLV